MSEELELEKTAEAEEAVAEEVTEEAAIEKKPTKAFSIVSLILALLSIPSTCTIIGIPCALVEVLLSFIFSKVSAKKRGYTDGMSKVGPIFFFIWVTLIAVAIVAGILIATLAATGAFGGGASGVA